METVVTREQLLIQIKNALQREEDLLEETPINEIKEWDSLAIISLIALFDSLFTINLTYNELNGVISIKDLIDKVKDKLE